MKTIILRNIVRDVGDKKKFTIEVIGDSDIKDDVRASIRELKFHPAGNDRRSLIDMLSIIEKHNFKVTAAERYFEDDDDEIWAFVLQL